MEDCIMADTPKIAYLSARKLGRKYLSDNEKKENHGYLPVLDDRLQGVEVVGEINVGQHEIPLKKIIGTRTAQRSTSFAGNFMPLLEEDTEFGQKWMSLYASHIQEGIKYPIKVYEYINRYYVQEGNKRVSVLNYCGAASIDAQITRVIPKRDESNKDISIYYEFLDYDRRAVFENLWFSRQGNFTKLVHFAEKCREYQQLDESVTQIIKDTHRSFRAAYKRVGPKGLNITTGDALLEYTRLFGFPYSHTASEIARNIQTAQAQFQQVSLGASQVTVEENEPAAVPSSWNVFTKRPKTVNVAFAFEDTPETNAWTRLHDVGRKRLEFKYRDKIGVDCAYNVQPHGEACYQALRALAEKKPDVLFTTSGHMSDITLRIALEYPDMIVLNCDRAQDDKKLNTYFPKTQDAMFLSGVIAGAMSDKNRIGFMTNSQFRRSLTYDVNAFALGARIVNPRAQVINCLLTHQDDFREQNRVCCEFSRFGADVAFVQQSYSNPLARKSMPGVFAQLYMLHPQYGFPFECIGAASCDWFVFYDRVVSGILSGESMPLGTGVDEAIHFGWGIDAGLVDVFGVDAFMGHNAMRLLGIFRSLLAGGKLHPFTGPVYDRDGVLRIERFHTPTLSEIQSMDWYAEPIVKVI